MKANISRRTFAKKKHYRKVNLQQGKVHIDADWNEQVDIEDYHQRTYLTDLIGNSGAPRGNDGFEIIANDSKIGYTITRGNYYVDGILCQNEQDIEVTEQPDLQPLYFSWDSMVKNKEGIKRFIDFLKSTFYKSDLKWLEEPIDIEIIKNNIVQISKDGNVVLITLDKKAKKATLKINGQMVYEFIAKSNTTEIGYTPALPTVAGIYVIYLDVWERHITFLDDPAIREKALGGPDTATRTKIIWQVKLVHLESAKEEDLGICDCNLIIPLPITPPEKVGSLRVRVDPIKPVGTVEPYAGIGNQLYRVEIHKGGSKENATFKWSRDNGAVEAKVTNIDSTNNKIVISDTASERKLGFIPLQWVEIMDDHHELWGIPGTFVQLKEVKDNVLVYYYDTIRGDVPNNENYPLASNPKIRRWDSDGDIKLAPVSGEKEGYIGLDATVQVKFGSGVYNVGDYWLIPTRTAPRTTIGDVEWPNDEKGPLSLPPEGITHHFCPVALLNYEDGEDGKVLKWIRDCRKLFTPMTVSSVNTGTVYVKFNLGIKNTFGPFCHYLQGLYSPPAIILGLVSDVPKVSDDKPPSNAPVMFMEDYDEIKRGINFKAVNIGLQTFNIALDSDATRTIGGQKQGSIVLRWWAIPGQEQIHQSS